MFACFGQIKCSWKPYNYMVREYMIYTGFSMEYLFPCGKFWIPVASLLCISISWTKISRFAVNVNELLPDNDALVISIIL